MLWLFILINLLFPLAQATEKPIVLITAFKAFDGNRKNGSREVARQIAKDLESESSRFTVSICILPVEYKRAAEVAQVCYKKLSATPAMVISLGEHGCHIAVETKFKNLDDELEPDSAGVLRRNKKIDPNGPDHYETSLPLAQFQCAMPFVPSTDAGTFVCNDTAYRLASYFEPSKIPYGFIHVPKASCRNFSPSATSSDLIRMIDRALFAPDASCEH